MSEIRRTCALLDAPMKNPPIPPIRRRLALTVSMLLPNAGCGVNAIPKLARLLAIASGSG